MLFAIFTYAQGVIRLLNGSDKCLNTFQYNDTVVFIYENYKVTTVAIENSAGEDITIEDTFSNIKCLKNDWASYFFGIISDKLIIDIGTSSTREFRVYKLPDLTLEFSSRYVGRISANDNLIHFTYLFGYDENFEKPDCPNKKEIEELGGFVGYYQKRDYNLINCKLEISDSIECGFLE